MGRRAEGCGTGFPVALMVAVEDPDEVFAITFLYPKTGKRHVVWVETKTPGIPLTEVILECPGEGTHVAAR